MLRDLRLAVPAKLATPGFKEGGEQYASHMMRDHSGGAGYTSTARFECGPVETLPLAGAVLILAKGHRGQGENGTLSA